MAAMGDNFLPSATFYVTKEKNPAPLPRATVQDAELSLRAQQRGTVTCNTKSASSDERQIRAGKRPG
jgi:hypothetical protein